MNPPRVLVITNNKIQPFTGGGVVLANLFHRFPGKNLFVLHADESDVVPAGYSDYRVGSLHLRLRDFARLAGVAVGAVARNPIGITSADLKGLAIQSFGFRIPESVHRKIREFAPEAIYAWTGDSIWARLLEHCVARYQLPYVIHFMDNHVELTGGTTLQAAMHAEYGRNLERVVKSASRIFTITPAMGVAYARKFGRPFEVFHGLIDREGWPWPGEKTRDAVFSMAFTGSIESGQLKGLRAVAQAAEALNERGYAVELVLYVTEFYERRAREALSEFRNVRYRRHPEFSELRAALTSADVLVLAYGFDEATIQYYRYSFATKIVPYMLSGRCILAYGPGEIEPIAYMKRGGWGHVVDENSSDRLEAAIVELMNDPRRREVLARTAYEAGLEEHDLETNSERFLAAMAGVASGTPA